VDALAALESRGEVGWDDDDVVMDRALFKFLIGFVSLCRTRIVCFLCDDLLPLLIADDDCAKVDEDNNGAMFVYCALLGYYWLGVQVCCLQLVFVVISFSSVNVEQRCLHMPIAHAALLPLGWPLL
jgi:hypothetical protein